MSDAFGNALVEKAEAIRTREEFIDFVRGLIENHRRHREEWGNDTVESFLFGLLGFCRDMEGYYRNLGQSVDVDRPSWRTLADLLLAARVYE